MGVVGERTGDLGRRTAQPIDRARRARRDRVAQDQGKRLRVRSPRRRIELLDARLVELARGVHNSRLELGDLLNALAIRGGHHRLGFSSLGAYCTETCGQRLRWLADSRSLARRLEVLPHLRQALVVGRIGWAMAELVARHATPDTDASLVSLAESWTVRQARQRLGTAPTSCEGHATVGGPSSSSAAVRSRCSHRSDDAAMQRIALLPCRSERASCDECPTDASETRSAVAESDSHPAALRLRLSSFELGLLEWTKRLAEHMSGPQTYDEFLSALLAETFSSLCSELPPEALEQVADCDELAHANTARELAWQDLLARWRDEAESRCEARLPPKPAPSESASVPSAPEGVDETHQRIRELSQEISARDVEFASAAWGFRRGDGARTLGYASEAQYARERLGVSASYLKSRIALAGRLHRATKDALRSGRLRLEAALLISRVASRDTIAAWIERAEVRTVKYLREEVQAAEFARTAGGDGAPPSEEQLRAFARAESLLLSGNRDAVLANGQMSGAIVRRLRIRVSRDTARFFRSLESAYRCHSRRPETFIRRLCDEFWQQWGRAPDRQTYSHIYERDRYRCSSPVCSRRDVTPHHVVFRSHGGSDEPSNVIALCSWCHLEGVHGGRIRVSGSAERLTWVLGTDLRVEGRQLRRSSANAGPWS